MLGREGMVPLLRGEAPPAGDDKLSMLLLSHGGEQWGYLVRCAIDIVTLTGELLPAHGARAVIGVAVIDGEPVEVVEPLRLMADAATNSGAPPICLLKGAETGWMEAFLRPTIEAAGYRVAHSLEPGETAAITFSTGDDALADANVIQLARDAVTGRPRIDLELIAGALSVASKAGSGR